MDESNKEILIVSGFVTVVLIVITIVVGAYQINRNNAISKAIEDGKNPIATACAFDQYNDSVKQSLCAQVVAKEKDSQ